MTDLRSAYGLITDDVQQQEPVSSSSMYEQHRSLVMPHPNEMAAQQPMPPPPMGPQIHAQGPAVQAQGHYQSTYLRDPQKSAPKAAPTTVAAVMPMIPAIPANAAQANSYVDALASKKRDMAKLVLMALVILFAISAHSVIDFSMRNFIVDNGLSFRQEVGLRMLYPALVIVVLWHLRAFSTGKSKV